MHPSRTQKRAERRYRREARLPLAAVCAVLLSACAPVGPDYVRPEVPANPAWLDAELEAFATDPAQLEEWWRALDDPVLDELIATARRENNSLEIAGLRVLESQARLNIAVGNKYPQQQVLAGNIAAIGASETTPNTGTTDTNFTEFNVGASIVWEIDFWGRFRRGIEAADAGMLASIASYDEALVLLTAQVADVYALIRATQEQLRLARESYAIQERSYEIAELLYQNGLSSELDALQARTQLLGTAAVIPDLETTLRQLKNALAALLGRTPGTVDEILKGEGSLPDIPESMTVGVPADLLRQRPDVRRAELQALAQNALVGVAEANLYPSFSLAGSIGVSSAEGSSSTSSGESGVDQLFSSDSIGYSIGPSFVWPFLNYGRIRNNIRVEDARLQQALLAYRETVIQAYREVEDAIAGLVGARTQDLILAEGVRTARRSAELSLLRYQEGFADYQRVLQAQQALFGQQQRYANNRGNVMRSFVALYRGLGGGWQLPSPVQYIDEDTRQEMQERTNWGDVLDNPPARR
jgi:NodT family efflux transporter outer membrane factor (OMF) lipoprotein